MIPLLALNVVGSPIDAALQMSDIALLLVVVFLMAGFYMRLDKFEETLAARIAAKQKAAAEPRPIDVLPNPLSVRAHPEWTPLKDHQALRSDVIGMGKAIEQNFAALREERSRTASHLHKRIEELSQKSDARSEELRREIKNDIHGIHERINEVLTAVSELRGSAEVFQKMHLK